MKSAQIIPLASAPDIGYYYELWKSLEDKMWFLERLPKDVSVIADFGCGDGYLLLNCSARGYHTVGYDKNPEPLAGTAFTNHLAIFAAQIAAHRRAGRKVCLVLSSVIHEVLSVDRKPWALFWRQVRALGCDYVAIRDMAVEVDLKTTPVESDLELLLLRSSKLTHWLLYGASTVGTFSNRAEMLQALLKYPYADTAREYAEDYFALSAEQYLNLTTIGSGYSLRHFEHYSMPYHVERWKKDFGVTIMDPTHIKLLLKRMD